MLRFQKRVGVMAAMVVWAVVIVLGMTGCTSRSLTLTSADGRTRLNVSYPTRVFSAPDVSSADFYATDLAPELWRSEADLSGASGTLVHVHLFMPPKAGDTPIGDAASNSSVRYVVLSRGEIGVYAGGGFVYPSGEPKDKKLGVSVWRASMRLVHSTPGFRDVLGASQLTGKIDAAKDDATSRVLAERLRTLIDAAHRE